MRWIKISSCGLLVSLFCGCSSLQKTELERFEFEEPQMGVPFRIILYAHDEQLASRAADAAFKRIAELNSILSDYETDSEINRLSFTSENGSPEVPLSRDLWNVLFAAQTLATNSAGAFDVTIGPCVGLWRKARREKQIPDSARLENARRKVGYTNLILSPERRSARLLHRGMRLDVGGIAKGYAGDEALKVLRSFGITRALVSASGDLAIGDRPPGAKGWRIEISGYDAAGGPGASLAAVANCGVASSGDLFQRLEIEGVRYSHILNPFTCIGMTNHALASVIARNGMTADGLATPMTILDSDLALSLASKYAAAVRIIEMENGQLTVHENHRFKRLRAFQPPPGSSERPSGTR